MSTRGVGVGGDAQRRFVERDRLGGLGEGGDEAFVDRRALTHGGTVAVHYRRPACPMACTRVRTPPPRQTSRPTSWPATGEVVTYAELDAAANRLSQVFHAHGLRPGDHVAFCLENHPRYFEVAWGAHYAGLIYTACSSRLTSGELAYIVDDCGAKAFVTSQVQGRAGGRDHPRHAQRAAAPHARRDRARLRQLRGGRRRAAGRAAPRPARVHRHALLVGHDRAGPRASR